MAKKPSRTWGFVFGMSPGLLIVVIGSMAISFPTLTDVATLAGLPFPFAYPFIVDGGMLVGAVGAANKRLRGLPVRRTYFGFAVLAVVSVVANAVHSAVEADPIVPVWAAAILGAVPPATLLWATHEVMDLVPDEKERAKLQALRERPDNSLTRRTDAGRDAAPARVEHERSAPMPGGMVPPVPTVPARVERPLVVSAPSVAARSEVPAPTPLRLLDDAETVVGAASDEEVRSQVLEHVRASGKRPTGKLVGDWLGGKTPKTGQRFIKRMEDEGWFASEVELRAASS